MFDKVKSWLQRFQKPEAVATGPITPIRSAELTGSAPAIVADVPSVPAVEEVAPVTAPVPQRRSKIYSSAAERLRHWRAEQKQAIAAAAEAEAAAKAAIESAAAALMPKLAGLSLPGGDAPVPVEPAEIVADRPAIVLSHPIGAWATFLPPTAVQPAVDWEMEASVTDKCGNALSPRSPERIRFLIPREEAESLRRGLPRDPRTGVSALTALRLQNDRDRNAYSSTRVTIDQNRFMVRPGSDGKQQSW